MQGLYNDVANCRWVTECLHVKQDLQVYAFDAVLRDARLMTKESKPDEE
jgi:hypothetical protein